MDFLQITGAQCRAARALLNWSQPELAERAGFNVTTIIRFESGNGINNATMRKLVHALGEGGVRFTEDEGVKRSVTGLRHFSGKEGFWEFYEELYKAACDGGEICLFNGVSELVLKWLGERNRRVHVKRMQEIKDRYRFRIIVEHGDSVCFGADYCEYRWFPPDLFNDKTVYVFGSKVGFVNFDNDNVHVILLDQAEIAQTQRLLFDLAWDHVAEDIPP